MESSPLHPTWLVDIQGRMMTRSMSSPERICEVMSSSCFFLVKQIREAQHFEHFGDLRSRLYSSSFHIYIYTHWLYFLNRWFVKQWDRLENFWSHRTFSHGGVLMIAVVLGNSRMDWCSSWRMQDSGQVLKSAEVIHGDGLWKRIIHTWCKVCMDDIRSANWSYLVLLDPFVRCWTCCCIDASKCRSVFTRILHDRWLCNMLSICPRLAIKTGIRTRL